MSSKITDAQVTIDLMQKSDLPEILAIEKVSFSSPWTEGMFAEELENKLAQCLVIRINYGSKSILAAYIIFRLIADEAHLHNLAVKKEFQRQSLARSLMLSLIHI